jgi:hypothetical protein
MLFDLRGRGRRRTVQVIYVTLAVLMGGGLIFFGIGGSTNGGLFDALGLTDGGSNTSTSDVFKQRAEAAEKRVRAQPRNPAAWAELTRVQFQDAGQGDGYDQNTSAFTEKGKVKLRKAARSWQRYLALKPAKPDAALARLMTQAYGPSGLNELDKAADAAEVVTQADPSSQSFAQLAIFAYAAGQTRKGDLARQTAIDKAPKDERTTLSEQLLQAKSQANGGGQAPVGTSGAATGTS